MFRRRILVAAASLLVLLGAWTGWRSWRRGTDVRPALDPRWAYAGPFRNVRPDVYYVGDAACAACHPDQATTYRRHPMGRSFCPVDEAAGPEHYGPDAQNPFEAAGFQFQVERRASHVFHQERRAGRPGPTFEAPVRYRIGSGTRACSYLIDREGYLFQSPITWYAQKEVWDLSPGFAANPHADRPIRAECLFCHCNDARAVPDTVNRYREPIFRGYAIGCERCHGPGELHVARQQRGDEVATADDTIVNPARLEPALRQAVCQQCHLQGEKRILRKGRQPFDFRPGLPLDRFWAVFVLLAPSSDRARAVGQVEQMVASRCYRASGGQLGCTSCHDPHAQPPPEARAAFYRSRCLGCHTEASCNRPRATHPGRDRDEDCIACHMPRIASSDVAHTAITDHRLLRPGTRVPEPPATAIGPLRDELPLVSFYPEDADTPRDLGLAVLSLTDLRPDRAGRMHLAEQALPLLGKAGSEDVAAGQARGYALWLLGRRQEAWDVFQAALAQAPEREELLSYAAACAAQLGRPADAADLWRRALAVNPWSSRAHFELARLLALGQQWGPAAEECQAVLRLHPFHLEARETLVRCYLQAGRKRQARTAFEELLSLDPPNADALRRSLGRQLP